MIKAYTGETVPISITVTNVADLVGATLYFGMKHKSTGTKIEKVPTADGNVASVTLATSETWTPGAYEFEFRIDIGDQSRVLVVDNLLLERAIKEEAVI